MPDQIANYSPEAVIEAIETNLIDSSVAMGRTEDGVVFRGPDVSWVYTGYRALNRVLRARFSPEEAEDRVAEITECFRQWDSPVMWVIGPSTWPLQVKDYLQQSGFHAGETWTGMAIDLQTLSAQLAQTESLRIETVNSKPDLEAWTLLSTEMWADDATSSAVSIFSPENAGSDPRCRYYLGYIGDQPVVRGMCCLRGEIAGLYWVDAKPEYREQGYDLALATKALTNARESGAKLGVLPVRSSPSNFEKIGFKGYCQFNVYVWPASPEKPAVC